MRAFRKRKRFAMKTRLNPLESRLHNPPTPEEVRREVAIIPHEFAVPLTIADRSSVGYSLNAYV